MSTDAAPSDKDMFDFTPQAAADVAASCRDAHDTLTQEVALVPKAPDPAIQKDVDALVRDFTAVLVNCSSGSPDRIRMASAGMNIASAYHDDLATIGNDLGNLPAPNE